VGGLRVDSDWLYQEELLIAEVRFGDCVRTGEVPVSEPIPAQPRTAGFREICFEGNKAWASAAADWRECREAAKRHAAATASLNELVDAYAGRAFSHAIEARCSRAKALSIREIAA
jgi:hypothetical protein